MRLELIKLKGGKCIDCGYNKHHAALDFDHVVGQKRYNISNMLNSVMAWKTILEEVAKCELVCSNCHRIRTFNRRQKK
jgi:hypothetical protein